MKNNSVSIIRGLFALFLATLPAVQCTDHPKHAERPFESQDNDGETSDTSEMNLSADLLYHNNLYYEAAEEYEKLINVDSANGKYYFRRAYSLLQIDSFSEASINYLRAANLKYREADCYFAIGTIHARSFNDSLAIVFLEKALKVNPAMDKAKMFLISLKKQRENSI